MCTVHVFTSAQLHICTCSQLHICTCEHLHMFISAQLHIYLHEVARSVLPATSGATTPVQISQAIKESHEKNTILANNNAIKGFVACIMTSYIFSHLTNQLFIVS